MYEEFVKNHKAGTFFQSCLFAEFQKKIPYRGKAWTLYDRENGGASCLAVKMRLPLGFSWLWVPYGPLGHSDGVFGQLEKIAHEEKTLFTRIEPAAWWDEVALQKISRHWKVVSSKERFTPQHSLILDLTKNDAVLLAEMKPKGRYNISIAKKRGVSIRHFDNFEQTSEGDLDAFYSLLKKTGERDGFGIHPKKFYEQLLEVFGMHHASSLLLAYHQEKVIAGIIIIFYKRTATYYYGAADHAHRNLMAPYLLQWEAIKLAKSRGMTEYDFLGIAPSENSRHALAGVTGFKKKFGGKEVIYGKAIDIVYKPLIYILYRLIHW